MKLLPVLALTLIIGPILLLGAGLLGLLKGTMPDDLGVKEGKLKPPSRSPNSVSSQAELYDWDGARYARIESLKVSGNGPNAAAETLTRIGAIAMKLPGARIMVSSPDYLYVQFTTRWLRFVDDVEFYAQPGASIVHVRSASRIGRKDFGVNRARVEAIRAALTSQP